MPASSLIIPDAKLHMATKKIDLTTDVLRIALSNTAPASQAQNPLLPGNGVLANVTQIAYTNYGDSLTTDRTLQGVTCQLVGTNLVANFPSFVIQPSGGPLATWRYLYIFDDTPTSPVDPLLGCWDAGEAIALVAGEAFSVIPDALGFLRF